MPKRTTLIWLTIVACIVVVFFWVSTQERPSAVIRHFTPRVPMAKGQRSVNVSGPDGSTELFVNVQRLQGEQSSVFASIASRKTLQALRLLVANDDDGDGVITATEWRLIAEDSATPQDEGAVASFKATIGVHDAYRIQEVYSDYQPCNTEQVRLGMEIAK